MLKKTYIGPFQNVATAILQNETYFAERTNEYDEKIRMVNNDGALLFYVIDTEDTDWKKATIFQTVELDDVTSIWEMHFEGGWV